MGAKLSLGTEMVTSFGSSSTTPRACMKVDLEISWLSQVDGPQINSGKFKI